MSKKIHDPLEEITADGNIVTGASKSKLVAEFSPILDEVLKHFASSKKDVSLYIYGSVATGTARVSESDVDLFTLGLDGGIAKDLSKKLSEKYSELCRAVEIQPSQYSAFSGSDDESYGNRVFLRHYCVHLSGPDFKNQFPDYPADTAAARGFNGDIGIFYKNWIEELQQIDEFALLGRRIARKTLLAISGLVSIHDKIWTTDRIVSAQRWAQAVPELKLDLCRLAAWSSEKNLSISKAEVYEMLSGTIAKIVEDFSKQIGLWKTVGV